MQVVLDRSPFYAESGGQVGDTGVIASDNFEFQVTDTQKDGELIVHHGHLVKGTMQVRVGREGEGYTGIRKQRVQLASRLLLSDDDGPFGAPTSDSSRTAVTEQTRNILVVLFCPVDRGGRHLSAALEHIAELLTRYCGASVVAVRVLQ